MPAAIHESDFHEHVRGGFQSGDADHRRVPCRGALPISYTQTRAFIAWDLRRLVQSAAEELVKLLSD
jgi:hypothetical protein